MISHRSRTLRIIWVPTTCLAFVTLTTCNTRAFNASSNSKANAEARTGGTLDVLDISLLYPPAAAFKGDDGAYSRLLLPLPKAKSPEEAMDAINARMESLSGRGLWPRVVKTAQNPEGFVDESVFRDIIAFAHKGSARFPKPVGIKYQFPLPSGGKVDLTDPSRWRVTSIRFEPCPYSVEHGLAAPVKKAAPDSSRPKGNKCAPEIRLVAQPIVGITLDEQLIARALPKVAAVHTLFERARQWEVNKDILKEGADRAEAVHFSKKTQGDWDAISEFGRMSAAPARLNTYLAHAKERIAAVEEGGWTFADYAIHAFFALEMTEGNDEGRSVAQELLSLKNAYAKDCPTSGRPLNVHPCFVQDLRGLAPSGSGSTDSPFARKVIELLSRHTKNLHKVAVFGTIENENPWSFFVGEVHDEGGAKVFEPIKIPAVANLSTAAGLNAKSETLEGKPFAERKAMQLSASSAIAKNRRSSDGFKSRYVPQPHPRFDSLNLFLRGFTNGVESDEWWTEVLAQEKLEPKDITRPSKATGSPQTNAQAQSEANPLTRLGLANVLDDVAPWYVLRERVKARIENPHVNNEFTVDCASCHGADRLPLAGGQYSDDLAVKLRPYRYPEQASSLCNRRYGRLSADMTRRPTAPNYNEEHLKPLEIDGAVERYVLNQFSIYKYAPVASQRVLNETLEAAVYANSVYFGAPKPNLSTLNSPWHAAEPSSTSNESNWLDASNKDRCEP